ncbi:VG15 protein [Nocardia nova]|uniref:VG15 protein n=1 Tax=Nocardia nova TaxID=37330 RepID=UPI00273823EC|nr:hypothetical protein [Nocardia nova]
MTTPQQQAVEQQSGLAWLAEWFLLQHQSDQRAIAATVVKKLAPLWRILNFNDLKGTQTPWIQAVTPIVQDAYEQSQQAAQQFLIDYRHASLPAAPEIPAVTGGPSVDIGTGPARVVPKVIQDEPFPAVRASVSLLSTGPGEAMKQMPAPPEDAMDAGRVLSSKVAVRIATDGGRNVVQRAVDLDRNALGYARVLNDSPCYFCAMLASRGAVYKANSFQLSNQRFRGEGVAKVHDGCRCGLRPVYKRVDGMDAIATELSDQWAANTRGLGGKDAMNAWRRHYVPPLPGAGPVFDLGSLNRQRDKLVRQGFADDSSQVRWLDRQIKHFGEPTAAGEARTVLKPAARAKQREFAKKQADYAAEMAHHHLPILEKNVASLLERGFAEDSPQVEWNRKQIARFKAALV